MCLKDLQQATKLVGQNSRFLKTASRIMPYENCQSYSLEILEILPGIFAESHRLFSLKSIRVF